MMKQLFFAMMGLVALASAQHNHEHHRVNVAVYYEALCPDSIKFFTQQLYPSLQGNLSQFVNLTLLPYGKSKTTEQIPGQYEFNCHHGPAECQGNRLQVCALRTIGEGHNSEGLGYNKVATAFINCLMDKVKPNGNQTQFPTQECATINHVPNYVNIENCANHVEGSQYLAEIGKQTDALKPPLTSVPTVVFNNQYKQDDNEMAKTNFVKALCQYIHGEKPAECTKNSAIVAKMSYALFVFASVWLYVI
ncbi:GILT-like protein 1 [Tribolium castaneum]|uniref:GILT-like protein 1 n=1 Tax=Tribolium castaneum TaxID=7070 RepID=UPI0030FE38EE